MSNKKVSYCNIIIERLQQVKGLSNLDDVANFLEMKASTLRSRKSRGSIPYEEIIAKLNANEVGYVFKGPKSHTEQTSSIHEPADHYSSIDEYEHHVEELIQSIKQSPFSQGLKIRLINIILDIAGKEIDPSSLDQKEKS